VVKISGTARSNKTQMQKEKVSMMVDGVLLGFITAYEIFEPAAAPEDDKKRKGKGSSETKTSQAIAGKFQCDFRIVNSWLQKKKFAEGLSELVVYSGSATVRFKTDEKRTSVILNRDDVRDISVKIKEKFTDFSKSNIRVTGIDKHYITLDVGKNDYVKQGFTGYIVEQDKRTGILKYLAEFTVINVFPTASTAFVVSGDRFLKNIRINSKAVIK